MPPATGQRPSGALKKGLFSGPLAGALSDAMGNGLPDVAALWCAPCGAGAQGATQGGQSGAGMAAGGAMQGGRGMAQRKRPAQWRAA
jgi:hypothetical protein